MVTNEDGHITQNVVYIPYGEVFVEERNGSWASPYLFNAKELDEETGLYYYGARYLEPLLCGWLSVDKMWEDHKGVSPYNYCLSNPVKLIDPDGNDEEEPQIVPLYIEEKRWPKVYENHENGLKMGHPNILTYDANPKARAKRRQDAKKSSGITPKENWNIDEYPYACTKEGGRGASVATVNPFEECDFAGTETLIPSTLSVPESENKSHGGYIGSQVKKYKMKTGDKFMVILVPDKDKKKETSPQTDVIPFPFQKNDNRKTFIDRYSEETGYTGVTLGAFIFFSEAISIIPRLIVR